MIRERIAKLIDVKSIVTIILTILFSVLALRETISQEVLTVYLMVVSFYFGTQASRTEQQKKAKDEGLNAGTD